MLPMTNSYCFRESYLSKFCFIIISEERKQKVLILNSSNLEVSGGLPGRTLGTRNFYHRNHAVPVLVHMLGFDVTEVNGSHHIVNFGLFQP